MPYPVQDTTNAVRWDALQNEFYKTITSTILREAGVGRGMQILDVGCGGGGVTALPPHESRWFFERNACKLHQA
jgi:2-polyprenyl-3-methyl-5-hydroxy-6-metoxy-1,4-benzoquinol methylase